MKCPVCDLTLSISSREGVEIDFCPQCRGVWLDRGELDKILDRVASSAPAAAAPPPPPAADDRYRSDDRRPDERRSDDRRYDDRDRNRYDDRDRYDPKRPKSKKKKAASFLEDIFDF